jgi:hypothetical protein
MSDKPPSSPDPASPPPPEPRPANAPARDANQPVFGRTMYDAIAHDILPLFLRPRTAIPIILLLALAALILFMLRTDGLTYETSWVGVRVGGSRLEKQSPQLKQCLAEARRLNKTYAIEAVTFLIQYEKDLATNRPVIRDSRRIFYTLRALEPININQETFIEEIDSHVPNHTFEHWFGNEKELFHSPEDKQQFKVFFDMNKDDIRTVVTGANFVLPLPFAARAELENHINVLANQNFYGYPNAADVICEMNMIVESRSLQIQPVGDAAKRYFEGNLKSEEARFGFDQSSPNGIRTISARWRNVMVGETVGIHFSWPEISLPH